MKVKEILKDCSVWIPNKCYKKKQPKVSYLMPTFQRTKNGYFQKAVDSVLNQTFGDFELIIVDDCSVDGTFDLIKDYMEKDDRISCIRHTFNVGLPAISVYEAYMKSRGDYIAFLFDDNEWESDALEKTYNFMIEKNSKASFGVMRLREGPEDGNWIEIGHKDTNVFDLMYENHIGNGAVIIHKEVLESVGLYDPHLALTRVCDWDLWRRIIHQYDFVATGIFVAYENGYMLSDSLGNSYDRDGWVVAEYCNKYRNDVLLPNCYEEHDIIDFGEYHSRFFIEAIRKYAKRFLNRKWFSNKDVIYNKLCELKFENNNIKRIAVFTTDISASISISFGKITTNDKIVIRFFQNILFHPGELSSIDAVVYVRGYINTRNNKLFSKMGIPIYYYTDDNFIEASKDFNSDVLIREVASLTTAKNLKKFQGVFLASQGLLTYFKEKNLHDNLKLLEPIIDNTQLKGISNVSEKRKEISIAFLGGSFRNTALFDYVLPAIKRVSEKTYVKFYVPENEIEKLMKYYSDNLEVIIIPRSISLELTLAKYKEKKIDIQVHCGENIRNNLYKTENGLLNSVQLGAVFISSNIAPYNLVKNQEEIYLLAENTIDDWYKRLVSLIDVEYRKELYSQAYEYCIHRYNKKRVLKDFESELESLTLENWHNNHPDYSKFYLNLYEKYWQTKHSKLYLNLYKKYRNVRKIFNSVFSTFFRI